MNDETAAQDQTNGLAVAGFVISIVGLCTSGLLSPIGLIISLVALKDQPRGFAIAGVVIGALGSCGTIIVLLLIPVFVASILAAVGLTGLAVALGGPQIEAKVEMGILAVMVEDYRDDHNALPTSFDEFTGDLDANSGLRTDPWGNPYLYELSADGITYRLVSSGPDGQLDTDDDQVIEKTGPGSWQSTSPAPPDQPAPDAPATDSTAPPQ